MANRFKNKEDFYNYILYDTSIPKGKNTKTYDFFKKNYKKLFFDESIYSGNYGKYVKSVYEGTTHENLNGQVFELIFECLLIQLGISPFFCQTEMTFISDIIYDIVLFEKIIDSSKTGYNVKPICISLKTSSRERYKQADLESMAFKQVHKNAECYLVLAESEKNKKIYEIINEKIGNKSTFGLDRAYDAFNDPKFNDFIKSLISKEYDHPKVFPVYASGSEIK